MNYDTIDYTTLSRNNVILLRAVWQSHRHLFDGRTNRHELRSPGILQLEKSHTKNSFYPFDQRVQPRKIVPVGIHFHI